MHGIYVVNEPISLLWTKYERNNWVPPLMSSQREPGRHDSIIVHQVRKYGRLSQLQKFSRTRREMVGESRTTIRPNSQNHVVFHQIGQLAVRPIPFTVTIACFPGFAFWNLHGIFSCSSVEVNCDGLVPREEVWSSLRTLSTGNIWVDCSQSHGEEDDDVYQDAALWDWTCVIGWSADNWTWAIQSRIAVRAQTCAKIHHQWNVKFLSHFDPRNNSAIYINHSTGDMKIVHGIMITGVCRLARWKRRRQIWMEWSVAWTVN
jgi:hypothetical protein